MAVTIDNIAEGLRGLRATFNTGKTRPIQWRLNQLGALQRLITENTDAILKALHSDLAKPAFEAWAGEIGLVLRDLKEAKKNLSQWMRPDKVSTPFMTQPGKSRIYKDPLGVVLIIAPWNYPFSLLMGPLIGAIAAGNAVVLKPSELAQRTSSLFAELIPQYLDQDAVCLVEGGIPETTTLLENRFDHIFFTGSTAVGRIVMNAAARHLTPVTLELGGKSPVYVHESAHLETTARRIAWGKFNNAGQTCISPDYVLVDAQIHDKLVALLVKTIESFYGAEPQANHDFSRIINERHHARLTNLLDSGKVAIGGKSDVDDLYIAPTVLTDVSPGSPVMSEEIFGPILPVLKTAGSQAAIDFINSREKPLALYVFTKEDRIAEQMLQNTSSGGATVNHVVLHCTVPGLPFGGVGQSGMGAYHGRASFETFTHSKAVLKKPFAMDPSAMYPPYTATNERILRTLF